MKLVNIVKCIFISLLKIHVNTEKGHVKEILAFNAMNLKLNAKWYTTHLRITL
jgi:hypothetical protein